MPRSSSTAAAEESRRAGARVRRLGLRPAKDEDGDAPTGFDCLERGAGRDGAESRSIASASVSSGGAGSPSTLVSKQRVVSILRDN